MTATIKDIAKYAGVSVGTVSKVLNNQGNVKENLRIRVEAVIDKFHYRPSSLARGMKISRTHTIGLIIPKITNSFYVQVIEQIEKRVNAMNHALVLGNSNEDIEMEINFLRTFSNMRIDGLVLASTGRNQEIRIQQEIECYKDLNIPVVLISRRLPGIDVDTVELENKKGAYLATRHLIENGHKRIGMISSSSHTSASSERIEGYMKALEEFQIPYESTLVHVGGLTIDSGYHITRRLLSLPHPPSAIFVGSNFQLLGTLRALKERNVRIPKDISLICFDDTEWSSFADPPLTVILPDTENFSQTAVDFLFDRIDGNFIGEARHRILPTKLVVRNSVKRLQQ
ncbi:MAG: LacI family DNA-binding transcriptional regulator [Deltaproteobacteria bacterium]|nr:LacI family DNA-binding transcriptional regulator [Deltaproteobacteria bacterium]